MRPLLGLLAAALVLALPATPALAQTVFVSEAAEDVSVAIYRDPRRGADDPPNLSWLNGYALVTEKRVITIPAGRGIVRFEGVAGRMLPESAIVSGLPVEVREKNLDADLLSSYSLYARSYGRPVTIRRTIGGIEREERAIIRSGPDGAAIFETAGGIFAADCRGNSESILFASVPEGLSAKPILSIETESPREMQATISLSYLAWGFDWQANYVATMRPDGKSADLVAWVTLANGDVSGFQAANVMAIAGKPNMQSNRRRSVRGEEQLFFQCLAAIYQPQHVLYSAPSPPPPPPAPMMARADSIVVTGTRVVQEELGDLKLYRVPHRTDLGAMNQKQVALLDRPAVPISIVYRNRIFESDLRSDNAEIILRAENKKERGLGVPLPQGSVAVFAPTDGARILVGEGKIEDRAVGEEIELSVASASQVSAAMTHVAKSETAETFELRVSNANPHPIRYEAELMVGDAFKLKPRSAKLVRRKGRSVWITTLPANESATLRYQLVRQR